MSLLHSSFCRLLSLGLCLCVVWNSWGWTPDKPQAFVSDMSGVLSSEELNTLERRLRDFCDSTSNQIAILITPSLQGEDIMDLAYRIGEAWGVGQKDLSNGVVILVKSKSDDEPFGDVAITTGYGLEGALPDVFCKRIIHDQMIPELSDGNYYQALCAALDVIEPVAVGEYSFDQYQKNETTEPLISLLVSIFVIVLILIILSKKQSGGSNNDSDGSSHPSFGPPFFGTPMRGGGSFGGFGSMGGGFGGFGGGHFGGGGAHGRF